MATDIERLVLQLSADVRGMERALDRAAKKTKDTARTVERRFDTMNTRITKIGKQLGRELGLAIGAIGLGLAIRETVEYADAWTTARNRLAAAGVALEDLAAVQNRLVELSQATRTGLNETVDLYARLTRSTQDLGASQEQIFRVTETLNKAFKAGGAAASEQRAAILQLGQALGSGVLQGDELRSIRENAPLVARAIAKEFDTTIAGLKQLGAEGQLTTERIFNGILNAGEEIEAQFAVTDATIADSFTNLQTSLARLIGNLDREIGASRGVQDFLRGLAVLADAASGAFDGAGTSAESLERRILQELNQSAAIVGEWRTRTDQLTESTRGLTREQVAQRRELQRTGDYQKTQLIERLQGLRDELAVQEQIQRSELNALRARRARGDNNATDAQLNRAIGSLQNIIKTDEALGRQIANAVGTPAAAFAEAAGDLSDSAAEIGKSFKELNLKGYETDLEKLRSTIEDVTAGYSNLADQVDRANAAQARAVEQDDGSDDALNRIRATTAAAADLQSKLDNFEGSRALVQAIVDYARASEDIAGAVAELDNLAGRITQSDAGLAMRELRQISEDLTAQILEGEDAVLADFQNKVAQIEKARSAAIAVGISDVGQFERAIAAAHTELTQALNALYAIENPFDDPDLSYLEADLPEFQAIGEELRQVMRQSIKDGLRESIATDDWGTALKGVVADAFVAGMNDALDKLGNFLADFFLGTNGNSGFFSTLATSFAGNRAGGGGASAFSSYKVNEGGKGEFLFMGNNPGQVLNAAQIASLIPRGGGGGVEIYSPIIVEGSLDHATMKDLRSEIDTNNRRIMSVLPRTIDARVNDSIVNRRLRR